MATPTSSSFTPMHTGVVIADRYELVRHVARGGMGDVYEGLDRLLQRRVAVKVYRAASPADRARFDGEVQCLASLNHPGLVRVYDAGTCGDDAFVVLEFIDGPPLAALIGEGGARLPPERVVALGADLADALDYIHTNGVVHRDVTPANVLCGPDGRPRLVDFGIARLLDSPRVTATSIAIGTAAYMAPEQVRGEEVTPAADMYSLGLVLLEALTGRREFVGSVQETAMARLVRDPNTCHDVPPEWQPLLKRLCLRDPSQRPSAAEVRTRLVAQRPSHPGAPALAHVGGAAPVAAHAVTAPIDAATRTAELTAITFAAARRAPEPHRAGRLLALVLGLTVGAVAAVALAAATRPHEPSPSRATATTLAAVPADTATPSTTVARRTRIVTTTAVPTTAAASTTVPSPTTTPLTFPTPPTIPPAGTPASFG